MKKRGKILSSVLAVLRTLSMHYETAHWLANGPNAYGDHLLYQRLYEDVGTEIDSVAERIVGLCGPEYVNLELQLQKIHSLSRLLSSEPDMLRRSQLAEQTLQRSLEMAYKTLDGLGELTLGLDDLIMSLASDHETHLYLIQQRLCKD